MSKCSLDSWSNEEFEAHQKLLVAASVVEAKFVPGWKQELNDIGKVNQQSVKAQVPEEAHSLAFSQIKANVHQLWNGI
jgi:hypothetical protein